MPQISLTASMRSNLLSLQNISGQVSHTQNRLATGKKVNSAIDNPSSFYTASSLTNRARDLDALLDAMSQATSTIKAATTALETATSFLEQASAVATQALETAIPAKEYFENLVGENGAVVSTAQELKDAVNSGKETICVYGKIDYFENETLTLKDGQNLVGTEYFTGYTGKEKFSQIHFKGSQQFAILCNNTTNTISDLGLNISIDGHGIRTDESKLIINNTQIEYMTSSTSADGSFSLYFINSSIQLLGVNNIEGSGSYGGGIMIHISDMVINKDAELNIQTRKSFSNGSAMHLYDTSSLNVYGNINIDCDYLGFELGNNNSSNNLLNIYNGAKLKVKSSNAILMVGCPRADGKDNNVNMEQGAYVELQDYQGQISLQSNGAIIKSTALAKNYYSNTMMAEYDFTQTESTIDWDTWQAVEDKEKDTATEDASKQYSEILSQYDELINDGSYKGVNLLKQDDLKVNFNEKNSASLEVKGKDMSTTSLGFVTKDWSNQGDIAQSLKEIVSALNSIRNYDAELGNNYSIISSRHDFTENLINILTEGADKLTLADMNEESANMLALQTRQQLAVNALSLASQASQSVLKLF